MKLFNIFFSNFKKRGSVLNLEWAVESKLISKAEMLLIKKNRATIEYENEVKPKIKKR